MAVKKQTKAGLTLGPVLFNWTPEVWRDFYFRIADEAPVDSVCIGEVVCSKRMPFLAPHYPEVVERLAAAGKQVVFSTLALVMGVRDLQAVRDLAMDGGSLVEANDVSALPHLRGRGHWIGPLMNVYNEATLALLADRGARRFCLSPEIPASALPPLVAAARDKGAEIELQAYGRMPLAVSARCYHARAHGLRKDNCQFVCGNDADGLSVTTMEDQPFLTVNGIQTMSHTCLNLLSDLADLQALGIRNFRLSPQSGDMAAVATVFRDVLDGRLAAETGTERLAGSGFLAPFSNGFVRGTCGHVWKNRGAA